MKNLLFLIPLLASCGCATEWPKFSLGRCEQLCSGTEYSSSAAYMTVNDAKHCDACICSDSNGNHLTIDRDKVINKKVDTDE